MHGSRNFCQGGPGQSAKKKAPTTCFFFSQLILQKSNGQFQRNLSFFKVPEVVQLPLSLRTGVFYSNTATEQYH